MARNTPLSRNAAVVRDSYASFLNPRRAEDAVQQAQTLCAAYCAVGTASNVHLLSGDPAADEECQFRVALGAERTLLLRVAYHPRKRRLTVLPNGA